MPKQNKLNFEYFPNFQDKDAFFEKLMRDESMGKRILNLYGLLVVFSFLYGIVMGCYNSFFQALSSAIKVPILFTLTLIICFPAFYIIQYVLGSKLKLEQMIAMILSGFVLTTAIMVAFAPIVVFFLITGGHYNFLKLLHVMVFTVSGFFGMKTIIDAMKFSCEKMNVYPKTGVVIFRFWIIILAFVGMQLSWILRPWVGDRNIQFQIFRKQEGNFYKAMIEIIKKPFQTDDKVETLPKKADCPEVINEEEN